MRYLALGDSYTVGEGIDPARRWPRQLAVALRQAGLPLADPLVVATTGWTTDELDAGIDAAAPRGPFDLVSLLVGVNDQYRGRALADYRRGFAALLERATGFAGGRGARVLVLAIPDWGVTPFAAAQGRDRARIATELDAFNAAAAALCAARGAAFVDIAPVSRERGAEAAMLAADGLHPSAAMHALWASQALPAARDALA
nr:GDSL-type esterase/lipase family protein [Stenotrophomonas sp. MMGLT7]